MISFVGMIMTVIGGLLILGSFTSADSGVAAVGAVLFMGGLLLMEMEAITTRLRKIETLLGPSQGPSARPRTPPDVGSASDDPRRP